MYVYLYGGEFNYLTHKALSLVPQVMYDIGETFHCMISDYHMQNVEYILRKYTNTV